MRIQQRLKNNFILSVMAAAVLIVVLAVALSRLYYAIEAEDIAGELVESAFTRSTFREDYLRTNSEQAKTQWFAEHDHFGELLKAAADKFSGTEDRKIIDELIEDHQATVKLFSDIVEDREKNAAGPAAASRESEERLSSQLQARLHDRILLIRKLRDSAQGRLFSALMLAGSGILASFAILIAAALINSWVTARLILDRIFRLSDGAARIGSGDLDYRISVHGDDEFAELSGSFNAMTDKLRLSYNDLRKAHDKLERRVAERTRELAGLNETLERRVAERTAELRASELRLAGDLAALTRMHALSARGLESTVIEPLLQEMMDTAVAIMDADKGTLQLLAADTLRIVAHHGHDQPFLDFFAAAENVASVCGEATRCGERVVIENVEKSPLFTGTASLPVLRAAGVRAVQSTPLITRGGRLLGILTTQWTKPHIPDEHDLWRLDLLTRQVADIIEQRQAEDQLQKLVRERTRDLREKEVLLKEVHHRVKNNLQVISSLVSLQADEAPNAATRAGLRDVTDRVRSMALVHEKLYQSADLARIDFAEYIESLLSYLWRAHGSAAADINLRLDLAPVSLPVDVAVPCGLILNELAGNALKHAFRGRSSGEVTVSFAQTADRRISLGVRDNGVGLPSGFGWQQTGSLGLRLVQMLAGQLRAGVEVSSGEGTRIEVILPAL